MQRLAIWVWLAVTAGCGADDTAASGAGGGGDHGTEADWVVPTGAGGCDAALYQPPTLPSPHVPACSVVSYLSNPPTSGPHYGVWANFGVYEERVPRGFYVHSMEHGAVVLAYNCPDGCDDDVEAMVALAESQPQDPACTAFTSRVIVLPDPQLDVPFAAAAWGHMLKADCFDEALVAAFVSDHYARAPENICGAGVDPTDPTSGFAAACGQ